MDNVLADAISRQKFEVLQHISHTAVPISLHDLCCPMLSTAGGEGFGGLDTCAALGNSWHMVQPYLFKAVGHLDWREKDLRAPNIMFKSGQYPQGIVNRRP